MNDEERLREAYKHFETALRAINELEKVYIKASFDAPIDRMFEQLIGFIENMGDKPISLILHQTVNDMETSLAEHRRLMGEDTE